MAKVRESWTILSECLACGGGSRIEYLDLGVMPLANAFHDGSKELPRFPLKVNYCPACFHSQLSIAVDPDLMFRDYPYVSGTSATLRKYMADFAAKFPRGIKVLDIASNDGTLLEAFRARGCDAWGVDPSPSVEIGSYAADHTIQGYWSERTAAMVEPF